MNTINTKNKMKLLATLTITLLTLSMILAIIPMASAAIGVTSTSPGFGPIGTTVTITGTGASAGGSIWVYWENLGGAVLNNTAYADGAGSYSVKATIPTAVAGLHSVIVQDVSTGVTIGTTFTITSTVTLTPTSGIPGDSINVAGTGFAASNSVGLFFNSNASRLLASATTGYNATYAATPSGGLGTDSALLNSTGATATSYAYARVYPSSTSAITVRTLSALNMPTFDYWFLAGLNAQPPALELQFKPATGVGVVEVTVFGYVGYPGTPWSNTAGSWHTTGTDQANDAVAYGTKADGTPIAIESGSNPLSNVMATIAGYSAGDWALTRVTAQVGWLGGGQAQSCYVDNFVFGGTANLEPAVTNATTTASGAIASSFKVPTGTSGSYTVSAVDNAGNSAIAPFIVGAAITLTPTTGPAGTVVTITGRGFTATANLPVTITVDGHSATNVTSIQTNSTYGNFTGQFIVPSAAAVGSGKTVHASDGTLSADALFNVTGTTAITLTPLAGQLGSVITIAGANFTAIAGTAVTVTFSTFGTVATLSTNATGGFSGTFTVPIPTTSGYTVTATDANGLTANKPFTIAVTFLAISPVKDPTGTTATVTSYGFTTSGGKANVTIGTQRVITKIADATLNGGTTFIVPTLPVGIYNVTALDDGGLTASTTYEVNATTALTITPSSAPPGTTGVTIQANYFTATDGTALTFTLKNATYTLPLNSLITGTSPWTTVTTNLTGSFNGTFTVNPSWYSAPTQSTQLTRMA